MRKLSNASDDSAFVSRDHKLSLTFLTPTVTNTSTTQTPVVTPGTPHRSPNLVINSGANDFLSVNKNHSRSQAASPGARSTHHGLSSTLPHSFSKHGLAKQKKQKRRPGNIVIDDSNVPNYITFQNPRSGNTIDFSFLYEVDTFCVKLLFKKKPLQLIFVLVVWKGIHFRSDTNRTGTEGLSFYYYPRLLYSPDQMLVVMLLIQHRVSLFKTVKIVSLSKTV